MSQHTLAVIMSVYYRDKLHCLRSAIDSVLGQTYSGFIFVINKDGPVCDSVSYFLQNLQDPRIKLMESPERLGLAMSLNVMIDFVVDKCQGVEFIARMDSDDICNINRFELQVDYLRGKPSIDVVGSWCVEFYENGDEFIKRMPDHRQIRDFACYRSPLIHPTVMFQRRIFDDGYRYNGSLQKAQDYDLWSRLLIDGYLIDNIQAPLLRFRISDEMHLRRGGLNQAISETSLRISHTLSVGNYVLGVWFRIIGFFIARCSPILVRRMVYKIFR
jgi:glycosyltransferase involved in cell wall biosynthesis